MADFIERLRREADGLEAIADERVLNAAVTMREAADALEALSVFLAGWIEHSKSRIENDGSPFDLRQKTRKDAFEQVAEYLRLHLSATSDAARNTDTGDK